MMLNQVGSGGDHPTDDRYSKWVVNYQLWRSKRVMLLSFLRSTIACMPSWLPSQVYAYAAGLSLDGLDLAHFTICGP